ncbi:MAG: AraC family transcriptional regulator [Lachnospiraceae bacterium]|nr:AraC family transcriptional regulator [Lachnospiraceae bacterium]
MTHSETEKKRSQISLFPVDPPFDAAYRNADAPVPVGPHSHNAAEIYFTLTDLPDVLLNDTVLAVPAGTLIVIPSFCVHQLYHESGVRYQRYILTIPEKWLGCVLCEGASDFAYLEDNGTPVLLFPDEEQKKELIARFDELLSVKDRTTPEAMVAFFRLLGNIQALKKEQKKTRPLPVSASQKKVNAIISYLTEHLRENICIADLASHFYMNPDYLARLFKRHMHVPIGHYITLQRISMAETLLREGKTVSEVQEYLGYSSYAHFFRTFQKITGISPSRYRRIN